MTLCLRQERRFHFDKPDTLCLWILKMLFPFISYSPLMLASYPIIYACLGLNLCRYWDFWLDSRRGTTPEVRKIILSLLGWIQPGVEGAEKPIKRSSAKKKRRESWVSPIPLLSGARGAMSEASLWERKQRLRVATKSFLWKLVLGTKSNVMACIGGCNLAVTFFKNSWCEE